MRLSSRRLLVLVQHLPDKSSTKTGVRGGDWDLDRHIAAGIYNVCDKLLEGYSQVHSDPDNPSSYEAFAFISPPTQTEIDRKKREEDQQREADDEEFFADIGMTRGGVTNRDSC